MTMNTELLSILNNPDCPNGVIHDWLLERGYPVASIYIVVGQCGEYSDRYDWYVAAFIEQKAARAMGDRLNQWCADHGCSGKRMEDGDGNPYYGDNMPKPPDDPGFTNDYTGTKYQIHEIPLRAE